MRFLFLTVFLAACGTDTFEGTDAATGDAATDGVTSVDGPGPGPDAAPFDPSQLSTLVLWLDAADAQTLDAGDLVASWPDHQNKYQTTINPGFNSQVCVTGLHTTTAPGLSGKPVVTFCNANLAVKDTGSLHLGSGPFFIAAVISPTGASADHVLFTKTSTGQSPSLNGLTLLAPNASGRLQGWLNGSASALSQNAVDSQWVYAAFARNGGTSSQIAVRVDGVPGSSVTVPATDDVSSSGDDIGIGGYKFDQGDIRHLFAGALAELVVVTGTDAIGLVETYFKKKYNL